MNVRMGSADFSCSCDRTSQNPSTLKYSMPVSGQCSKWKLRMYCSLSVVSRSEGVVGTRKRFEIQERMTRNLSQMALSSFQVWRYNLHERGMTRDERNCAISGTRDAT